ncbi:SDR family NAD(P)-dependent oxidoreductase [Fictibacillus phosphorivorans]|uniref:SDR family NAD(P)-dependent oxidoreductase n=1 Tax=Fictibacillus phosphorivorans TaxID=1221500 RepID=UPI00129350CD|nr:SDR family oxidoreductase [Fictibacillus phosphorivorans]MQR97052.1 SDR family oxidoreductase [Fictibacillus phosphorivorans]
MLLKDKIAVVYGAGGAIGGAVARAFAEEGASVFLAGRSLHSLQIVANDITDAGGVARVTRVDALNQIEIDGHLDRIVQHAGKVDISFNAIGIRGDLQGTPLTKMTQEDFMTPILTGVKTHFLTSTAAAKHMIKQNSGVIITLSALSSALSGRDRTYHLTGGFATACAAIEEYTRSLAGELGSKSIRVVSLRSEAIQETWKPDIPEVKAYLEEGTALGRLPTLKEVADTAVFIASDRASAITGAIINITCGSIMD